MVTSLCLCMENDERTAICVESSLPEKISSLFIIFSDYFSPKMSSQNHDGSGQKFLLTSDSIWPRLMALVIIMVCKLGGTSSISAEKFVNPWKISIMSEPIITRDAGMKISKAFFSSLQKFVKPKRSNRSTWLIDCSKLGFLISVSLITSVSYGVSS